MTRKQSKRALDSESKASTVVDKLEMLRTFVSGAEQTYSEGDLMNSLRQSSFNVERAAERLMTGQYKKAPPSCKKKETESATSPKAEATTSTNRGSLLDTSQEKKQTNRSSISTNAIAKTNTPNPTGTTFLDDSVVEIVQYASTSVPNPSTTSYGWVLCQRWVSDAVCLTKNGRIRHKEQITFTHSTTGYPVVRFRASELEGKLSEKLSTLLTPLLRHDPTASASVEKQSSQLICLTGEALMADRGLAIGAHIPISITVWIPYPQTFFALFMDFAGTSHDNNYANEWTLGKRRQKKTWPLTKAAFELLQWAQYGNMPDFGPLPSSAAIGGGELNPSPMTTSNHEFQTIKARAKRSIDRTEEVDSEEIEMDEASFDSENVAEISVQANELTESVVHDTEWWSLLPEADDPTGLKDVQLRPYQKQALYWMSKRENEGETQEEIKNQLSLLSELVGLSQSVVTKSPYAQQPGGQDITCDCGPVILSETAQSRSKGLDGEANPINHPLWRQRYLANVKMDETRTFYVNELLGVASSRPPDPPKPCSGGILADSMGLGKTVMLMALILKSKQERTSLVSTGPTTTLVVAKLSVLTQWEDELRSKTSLSYRIHYGQLGSKDLQHEDLDGVDVVVTTYGTVQGEVKRQNSILLNYSWLRVVLDEAHCIRNQRTVASKACCSIHAQHRWCVSGTIIQNSLDDVFGMMKFLKHEPWCWPSFWKAAVTSAASQHVGDLSSSDGQDTSVALVALDRVRRALGPIMLRRTKESLTKKGELIVQLPPVEAKIVKVEFSENERDFYNAVLAKSRQVFEGYVESGKASRSFIQIFALLQRLRQVCDHISLTVRTRIDEQDACLAQVDPLKKSEVDSPLRKIEEKKDSLGTDFLECLLEKFCSHESSPRKHSIEQLECVTMPTRKKPVAYLSQVAEKLTNAVKENSTNINEECSVCLEPPKIDDAVVTPCGHIFCCECLVGYLQSLGPKSGDQQGKLSSSLCFLEGTCPCCNEKVDAKRIVALSRSHDNGRIMTTFLLDKKRFSFEHSKSLEKENLQYKCSTARQILESAVRGTTSSKLTAVVEELYSIWTIDPGSKVLVFSHYLGFLDLLEVQFRDRCIPFCRMDGSLSLKERMNVLEQFRSPVTKPPVDQGNSGEVAIGSVLLMSMSAGPEGLNLVAASSCFICEPWWNSAKEDQCINRIHRIGQEASVVRVRKFIVNNSVEERIVELQLRKSFIADEVYDRAEQSAGVDTSSRLSLEELKQIFRR